MARAGKLRHKVRIESSSATRDEFGAEIITWATYATRSAEVVRAGGGEGFKSDQDISKTNVVFKVRHDSLTKAIDAPMRVIYLAKVHNVQYVEDRFGNNRELFIVTQRDETRA